MNQLYREALMGNSDLNEKEKKHYEILKSEESKMRDNYDTRCQLEEDAKANHEIMMNLRGEIFELRKKLIANRNNEYESNVRDKNVVTAKSLEKFIRSSGFQIVGPDGSDLKSREIRNKNDLKSSEEKKYSLQVPRTLGQVSWVAPPQRFQSRFEDIQQEEEDISEVISEQDVIYNSLGLQGSEEQGGATALEEDDGYYMPSTNNDYYDEPY